MVASVNQKRTPVTPSTHAHKLDSSRVEAIFMDCLFNEGEDTTGFVPAEGITTKVGFHPVRLAGHKAEVEALLDELPDVFKMSGGGGMSFLQAHEDRHGRQWTDYHKHMEQLFQLGIGVGKVVCLMPREAWHALPGGVPYYGVK